MPTTQETLALVQSLSAYLNSTLALVSQPSSSSSTSTTTTPPSLADVRNDLSLLLAESNKHLTAASLACKPPIALDALHGSLAKLEATFPKLRFALEHLAAGSSAQSSTRLARKLRWGAREALEAFAAHLAATAALLRAAPSAQRQKRDHVLVATKGVWAALERFDALPRTRLEAEREAWKDAMAMLDDCADEVKALAARDGAGGRGDEGGTDGDEGEREDDDEGEEDESPLTATERSRALLAAQLVRLARLLLAHLYQRTSPPPASTPPTTPPTPAVPAWTRPALLDAASAHASALSEAGDELAGVLEPGQDADEVADAVEELCDAAEELAAAMERALDEGGSGEGEREDEARAAAASEATDKEREWLAMWRRQRDNARDKLAGI
ncbi:hypothetical protein JCM3775_002460 [Rhodotorula graminis]|uniref:Cyclin-D1-binding protein 1-like N-terminal domain-containing protein n=1 Tax=Rhodotorula graminis (strain WP1) TaxID=578459 RepID=A0A0P9GZZ5_RHOGW|nr:uncharacterized protein RHOBADRAFT_55256 [Rhodotorula graminis WP1]KPV73014.1 hypothetical protein RHOBADRAFT_55256 [Rhodotorula graminis WP1]